MLESTRCKFRCASVEEQAGGAQNIRLQAMYDNTIPEDRAFNTATPMGELTAWINNPAVQGFFQPGKSYYLDISPAPE